MTVFFTADPHLHHKNIIKYCNRPFSSVEEMDTTIINNWNSRISDKDTVYILGDWVWTYDLIVFLETLKKLNGKKYLITGNHDNKQFIKKAIIDGLIEEVYDVKRISINNKVIWLSHYPHRSWDCSFHGSWHLYGHVHNTIPDYGMSTDVGMDKWNFYPVSFEELQKYFDDRIMNLNDNPRDNYKSYKKKFETHFVEKYKERIDSETKTLENMLEEKEEIDLEMSNIGTLPALDLFSSMWEEIGKLI